MTFYGEYVLVIDETELEEASAFLSQCVKFNLRNIKGKLKCTPEITIKENMHLPVIKNEYKFTAGIKYEVDHDNDTPQDQEASKSA